MTSTEGQLPSEAVVKRHEFTIGIKVALIQ